MSDDELEQKIAIINNHLEFIKKRIASLESWQSSDGKPSVDRFNQGNWAELKDVRKIADDGDNQLERRIKVLEDKTKNLKK
jgi:hypothetical protein